MFGLNEKEIEYLRKCSSAAAKVSSLLLALGVQLYDPCIT